MSQALPAEWWRPEPAPGSAPPPEAVALVDGEPGDSPVAFWGLMAYTFIVLLAPQAHVPALSALRIALLTAGLAIASHLLDRLRRHRPVMTLTRETWITAALVAWAVVTVPMSYWPGGSVAFLADFYLKSLAIFWLVSNTVNTPGRLWGIAVGLTLMAVPLAQIGIANFASGSFMQTGSGAVSRIVGSEAGMTGNPNDLALMLNLILPLSVALLLSQRRILVRAVLVAIIALEAAAVILTFSRAGFLTLAVTTVVYLWRLVRRGRAVWAAAIVLVALSSIPLLPAGYLGRVGTISNIESDPTGSAQTRWRDTMAAVQFVLSHPIVGAGVGNNWLALNEQRGTTWSLVHNVYLEYAVELGLPGLFLFLLLFVLALRNTRWALQAAARCADSRLFHLAQGVRTSLVAFAVSGLFHPVGYHFHFYYLSGLAVALRVVSNRLPGREAA